MKAAADFVNCLGRALNTMAPSDENAGLVAALEFVAYDALCQLMKLEAEPVFLLEHEGVVMAQRPLTPLPERNWTRALTGARVTRLRMTPGLTREEFGTFVQLLRALLTREIEGVGELSARVSQADLQHFDFGWADAATQESSTQDSPGPVDGLLQEIEATEWLLGQAARGERISHGLTWTVANSLHSTLDEEKNVLTLLLPLQDDHRYAAVHAMNASLLAMALAIELESSETYVRAVGEAAILHDVGQARVPKSIVRKPGRLSPTEWEVVKRHPVDGARMLMDSGPRMNLAATVAYEHHIGYDGKGYPAAHSSRRLHPATRILQVCDVFDALRTRRPFRDRWTTGQIKSHLWAESGRSLHPDAVEALARILDEDALVGPEGVPRV